MKPQLFCLFLLHALFSCSKKPISPPIVPGAKLLSCDKSGIELLRVDEDSQGKDKVMVSTLDFLYPIRLFKNLDIVPSWRIINTISRWTGGVDLRHFSQEATKLVHNRKNSFWTSYMQSGRLETLDLRMFLDKGDYVFTVRKGCNNETGIIYDDKLTTKYIYTFGVERIALKRDIEGDVESSIDFRNGDEEDKYQYFYMDQKIAFKYLPSDMWIDKFSDWRDLDETSIAPPIPKYKLYRDQTLVFNHKNTSYTFFQLVNSPYYFYRKQAVIPNFRPNPRLFNLIDIRRGVAFSFLENQIEREVEEVDKTLLQFEVMRNK